MKIMADCKRTDQQFTVAIKCSSNCSHTLSLQWLVVYFLSWHSSILDHILFSSASAVLLTAVKFTWYSISCNLSPSHVNILLYTQFFPSSQICRPFRQVSFKSWSVGWFKKEVVPFLKSVFSGLTCPHRPPLGRTTMCPRNVFPQRCLGTSKFFGWGAVTMPTKAQTTEGTRK